MPSIRFAKATDVHNFLFSFLTVLAERAGHSVAFERPKAQAMLDAMIKSFDGDEKPLAALIERLIS
jgi:cell filamentation protein